MKKFSKAVQRNVNQKGFTLIELVIALAIVGLIIGVLVGILGNPLQEASVNQAVSKIADDMRAMDDGAQKYYADNTAKIAALADLTSATGSLKYVPAPPTSAKDSGHAAALVYAFDNANYNSWGSASTNDTIVYVAGITSNVCKRLNERFAGVAVGSAVPNAVDATKDLQCYNDGTNNTVVKLLYVD